jgi:hypothetical protein
VVGVQKPTWFHSRLAALVTPHHFQLQCRNILGTADGHRRFFSFQRLKFRVSCSHDKNPNDRRRTKKGTVYLLQ